ncbi:MAG: rod shape-determining protein MreC [Minisyncoccia bacterium]
MNQRQKKLRVIIILLAFLTTIVLLNPFRFFVDKQLVSSNFFLAPKTNSTTWLHNLFHIVSFTNDYNNLKIQNQDLITNYLSQTIYPVGSVSNTLQGLDARVLKMEYLNQGNYFWINKGSKDGIAVGMNVGVEPDIVLGYVFNVYGNSSLVKSILSPKTKVSIMDVRSKSLGVATVNSQGKFYLDYLQVKSDIKINDLVISTTDNTEYLAGLIVGKVVQEDKETQTYYLEPLVNPKQTFQVKVFTQPNKQ